MKNTKYGFTIPELLAVIVIIGILITIATASYTTISNNMKQKTYDNKIDLIRTKALEYANDNGVDATLISVAKLISDGYLEIENDTEKNEKISNPLGGYLDCYHIKLNRNLDEHEVEVIPSNDCSLAEGDILASNIDIYAYGDDGNFLSDDNILGKNNDTKWTKNDVYLYLDPASLGGLSDSKMTITWSINGNNDIKNGNITNSPSKDTGYANIYKLETSYLLNAVVTVKVETTKGTLVKKVSVKIDKEAPSLTLDTNASYETSKKIITFNGSDKDGSGFLEYAYALTESLDDTPVFNITSSDAKIEVYENKTYYGYTIDAVGNISNPVEIAITNIDNSVPVCKNPVNNANWSTSYTYSYGCKSDIGSGCAMADVYETQTEQREFKQVNWTIKDNIGNETSCSYNLKVNVDTTDPTCEISVDSSSKKGLNNWYISDVKLNLVMNDEISGVSEFGISTSPNPLYNGLKTITLNKDTDRLGITYYGYVKDKAGNTGKCSINVKRLTELPTCNLTVNGTQGNNGWYRSNVVVKVTGGGTAATYGKITVPNGVSNNDTYTITSDTKGMEVTGTYYNDAGLSRSCSKTIKKDATAPKATLRMKLIAHHCVHKVSKTTSGDCGDSTSEVDIDCNTWNQKGLSNNNNLKSYLGNPKSFYDKGVNEWDEFSTNEAELVCDDATSGGYSYNINNKNGPIYQFANDSYAKSNQYFTYKGICYDAAGNTSSTATEFDRYETEREVDDTHDYFGKTDCETDEVTCAEITGDCQNGTEEKCVYKKCDKDGSWKCDKPDRNDEVVGSHTEGEYKWRVK